MNRRRATLAVLCASIGCAITSARAQQPARVYRIGYLSTPTRASVAPGVEAFLRKLRDLGWVEGQNLIIEYRWAEGDIDRLPALADELVRRRVDLIVAPAGSAALAAKNATRTIPIVMIFAAAPVELGLVPSLARPGGNITGTTFTPSLAIFGKQLEFLKAAVPTAVRIATLWNPVDVSQDLQRKELQAASSSLGVQLQHFDAQDPAGFDSAFAAMARERANALLVTASSTFLAHQARLAELALKQRLPSMFSFRESVQAGGLMAYAVNMSEFVGRAATYVDKILRGANPGDLPIEQPTRFELIVNLKVARALGITLPPSLLARADDRIQ
jgi:putative ABC transport system substrate-binding protein